MFECEGDWRGAWCVMLSVNKKRGEVRVVRVEGDFHFMVDIVGSFLTSFELE